MSDLTGIGRIDHLSSDRIYITVRDGSVHAITDEDTVVVNIGGDDISYATPVHYTLSVHDPSRIVQLVAHPNLGCADSEAIEIARDILERSHHPRSYAGDYYGDQARRLIEALARRGA